MQWEVDNEFELRCFVLVHPGVRDKRPGGLRSIYPSLGMR